MWSSPLGKQHLLGFLFFLKDQQNSQILSYIKKREKKTETKSEMKEETLQLMPKK